MGVAVPGGGTSPRPSSPRIRGPASGFLTTRRFGFALLLAAATPSPDPPPAATNDPVQRLIDSGLASDGAYRKLEWLTDRIAEGGYAG